MADFRRSRQAALGCSLPIMVTKRVDQIRCSRCSDRMKMTSQPECKRMGKWSAMSWCNVVVNSPNGLPRCEIQTTRRDCSDVFSSLQLAEQGFYVAFQLRLQRGGADHQQMRQVGLYRRE